MARPIPNDPDFASASLFDVSRVVAEQGLARPFATASSNPAIAGAPQGAALSNDVGATTAPASSCRAMNDRKQGMGALGRRSPAR